jgi:hypothetical protein
MMKSRVLGILCAAALLALPVPTQAMAEVQGLPLTVPEPTTPVTGNSTYFDGLGSPYGGCGLPQPVLESQDFVALNVYDTPGDYAFYPRPVTDESIVGIWNNGLNCGRWVQVTIGDFCTGVNDGAPGQAFCRGGSWVGDAYNGAELTMLVADSCGDSNAWCRDDPYHLDLAKASLSRFEKDGVPVGDLLPDNYNNRRMEWTFVAAPDYTGDIQIGFLQGAQQWWPAISVSRLPNGIRGVEYLSGGAWQPAQMNSDMGQSYIIGGTTSGGTDFQIRVRDASGALVQDGRVYSFSLPASCSPQCGAAYTEVSYTTDDSTPTPTPTPSSSPSPSPTGSATPTGSPGPSSACTAQYAVVGAWSSGHQAEVVVRNDGPAATSGWTVAFAFPGPQQVASYWSAVVSQAGSQVSASNVGYNGSIPAGGTAVFGMIVNGSDQPPAGVTCTAV